MASQLLARPFAALRPTAVSADEARALAANRPAGFLHISRPEIDLPPGSSPYSDAAYERGAEPMPLPKPPKPPLQAMAVVRPHPPPILHEPSTRTGLASQRHRHRRSPRTP
jgi:hypothetical protein